MNDVPLTGAGFAHEDQQPQKTLLAQVVRIPPL
jgi:hypothetical protein